MAQDLTQSLLELKITLKVPNAVEKYATELIKYMNTELEKQKKSKNQGLGKKLIKQIKNIFLGKSENENEKKLDEQSIKDSYKKLKRWYLKYYEDKIFREKASKCIREYEKIYDIENFEDDSGNDYLSLGNNIKLEINLCKTILKKMSKELRESQDVIEVVNKLIDENKKLQKGEKDWEDILNAIKIYRNELEKAKKNFKKEIENKAKKEIEERKKQEAEKKAIEKAQREAEEKEKKEIEEKKRIEAEKKAEESTKIEAQKEAEKKIKEEAKRKAKEEAEKAQKAEEKERKKVEEEAKKKAREEAEKEKAKKEAEKEEARKAKEEVKRKESEEKKRMKTKKEDTREKTQKDDKEKQKDNRQKARKLLKDCYVFDNNMGVSSECVRSKLESLQNSAEAYGKGYGKCVLRESVTVNSIFDKFDKIEEDNGNDKDFEDPSILGMECNGTKYDSKKYKGKQYDHEKGKGTIESAFDIFSSMFGKKVSGPYYILVNSSGNQYEHYKNCLNRTKSEQPTAEIEALKTLKKIYDNGGKYVE